MCQVGNLLFVFILDLKKDTKLKKKKQKSKFNDSKSNKIFSSHHEYNYTITT